MLTHHPPWRLPLTPPAATAAFMQPDPIFTPAAAAAAGLDPSHLHAAAALAPAALQARMAAATAQQGKSGPGALNLSLSYAVLSRSRESVCGKQTSE